MDWIKWLAIGGVTTVAGLLWATWHIKFEVRHLNTAVRGTRAIHELRVTNRSVLHLTALPPIYFEAQLQIKDRSIDINGQPRRYHLAAGSACRVMFSAPHEQELTAIEVRVRYQTRLHRILRRSKREVWSDVVEVKAA